MVVTLAILKQMIEDRLKELTEPPLSSYDSLYEAARYTLLNSGKRVRPLLTLAASEMVQRGSSQKALDVACAIEMIHTYSLIHDDLPCMDDDDFRRGKPSLHRVYGEGHAVLVGDFLLTYAFDTLAKSSLSSEKKLGVILSLSKGAGPAGMIGGQVMDISSQHKDPLFVEELNFRKTAALFGTSLECAALVNGAPQETKEKLYNFGLIVGHILQLIDDLIDQDHPLGQESAFRSLQEKEAQAQKMLKELPGDSLLLKELLDSLLDRVKKVH